ncbi:YjdF family protein [Sinanaerobacter chloroacetimidivorans]|jgi:hypothetical protein|uniref:YjdF family protein n=1 Tax=Sinanaerobacter chloroacetimidivorans TaxID=2818044 RepID=A0A8J7VZA6_9FIRM|nr:YjdF family protein [Sinanaerobacter chloroacetimidivorans]MBR0596296.1 YjdF family protein [Sinanaerobacter chloroacetimidivorans]
MIQVKAQLTVFFEDPFWVGVYERIVDGNLEAGRIIFGSEPKDYEIYHYILHDWNEIKFSKPIPTDEFEARHLNPKRMQREISRQLKNYGVGTKAQQALKLQQEQKVQERKSSRRMRKEAEEDRKFELRQQKKKEKHRGR